MCGGCVRGGQQGAGGHALSAVLLFLWSSAMPLRAAPRGPQSLMAMAPQPLPHPPPRRTRGCMATPVAQTHVPNGSTLSASSPLRLTVSAPGPTRFTLHGGGRHQTGEALRCCCHATGTPAQPACRPGSAGPLPSYPFARVLQPARPLAQPPAKPRHEWLLKLTWCPAGL